MEASNSFLANKAVQIVILLAMSMLLYAALYRPMLRMMGERPSRTKGSQGATRGVDEGLDSTLVGSQEPEVATKTPSGVRITWYRDRLLLLTVPVVLAIDQLTKYLVRSNLDMYESWPREGIVRLTYGSNTGMAFGLFPDYTLVLVLASLFAVGFLFYFYRTQAFTSRLLRLAIGLQLGGALGNLVDRLWTGTVVDFIDVGWWPIFNLADSSVVVGITLLISVMLLSKDAQMGLNDPKRRLGLEE